MAGLPEVPKSRSFMTDTDTKIMDEIINDISKDWGIGDDIIADLLHNMCPGRMVSLQALVSGKVKPTDSDIVDLLNVRERLRRVYALKSGKSLSRQAV